MNTEQLVKFIIQNAGEVGLSVSNRDEILALENTRHQFEIARFEADAAWYENQIEHPLSEVIDSNTKIHVIELPNLDMRTKVLAAIDEVQQEYLYELTEHKNIEEIFDDICMTEAEVKSRLQPYLETEQ